ncbi:hypothetical protein E8E11_000650 [Didymella keratinophila]|nr:hypothetical protein E8E11_000650 [Didymella keratinophila]
MSTVARGGTRGGRGRGAGTGVWRGSNTRGGLNGASSESSDRPAFGAKKRGGGAPNGGKARSNAQELDEDGKPKEPVTFVPMKKYGAVENSTPHAKDDYNSRFDYLKAAQPSWRKQLQEKRLMNPEGQMKLEDSVKLIGLCNDMCPEFERVRRIAQKDYKRPECTPETEHLGYNDRVPDESRMVKAFTRSAAGVDVELVIDIRNPAACLKTVKYLFGRLDKEGFDHLHAWIWDRTRSVRKDLRTQVVEKPADIRTLLICLEASARFYLLSMHQMAQTSKEDYSHQQDMEQFNQTLTTLRERYDDNRRAGIPSENEAEFVAYRLILASMYANSQLENELHNLPTDLRNNKRVLTAIEIFKAAKSAFNFGSDRSWIQAQANWQKFWALVRSPSVSYLMACAAEVTFNRVRHVILDSLWHAYRRGGKGDIDVQAWTTDQLKDVLAMDDDKDAVKLCELFGFHFERNAEGRTYLDISKLGNSNRSLSVPHSIKPQMFSQSLVESKRHNRAFSAIIEGMTVQQAKTKGLLVDPSTVRSGNEDSLFIPETATAPKPTNMFGQVTNGATTNGASSFNPNPFAKPFQPSSPPSSGSSAPNPFGGNVAPASRPTPAPSAPVFGGSVFPTTTFDAAKNPIKFATTPASSTNDNPFAKAAAALPPQSTTPQSTPPGSFNLGFNAAPAPQSQPSVAPATPTSTLANGEATSGAGKPFVFPGLPELDARIQRGDFPGLSTTPAASPPPPDAAAEAADKEKAEADARAAVLKQRQEAEERRKREQKEQERRAKEAREAEQRRVEEEKQRQSREQQEREIRARQERERLVREEQQRRQREEQEQLARAQRREAAYNALTSNIVFSGEDGLLYQFLENTVKNVAAAGHKAWQAELQQKREAEERESKRKAFARAVFTHWVAQVQKKKRNAKAKERRKRLKAQREQSLNGEGEAASDAPSESVASTDLPNGDSKTRGTPANERRARRTQKRRASAATDKSNITSRSQADSSRQPQNAHSPAVMMNGHHTRSYSEAYQKSTAPIDRTETDWFKLRAMGIDPSKHRKRSFDSATDEDKEDAEAKRVRRSDSNTTLISQQPPPEPEAASKLLTIDERLARIRAAKQSFKSSGSWSPPVSGATPSKRSSFSGRASLVIAQARELLAKSPTAKQPPVTVHDFGRSVPNLSMSTASFRSSALGKSIGTAQSKKPAYWGRASRFVPQHLYGKGPEAIREYRDKYVNSPTSTPRPRSNEPLALSSPIPTQFPYVPQRGPTLPQYSEDGSASGVDVVDVDAEDNVAGDTEEDSFDGDDEEAEHDEEYEEDEDEEIDGPDEIDGYADQFEEEEEYTEEEDQHFAQPGSSFGAGIGPGATQDDAIELSD